VKALRLVIEGRVQGVGFRAWTEREALARGLTGFVRNRRDGSVEAVICGENARVDDMVIACNRGPRSAVVTRITSEPAEIEPWAGFEQAPTA
jgi:acylphosphatase